MKRRPMGQIWRSPYTSPVSFDNRTADRESHAHAIGLARIESRTMISAPGESSFPEPTTRSRRPSLTPLIASIALMIKLSSTCCSWTRSPGIDGKSLESRVSNETPPFSAWPRVRATTSRIVSLMSNRVFRGGTFLTRARIRLITSPARLASLTIWRRASRPSSKLGGWAASQRNAAPALVATAAIG